MDYILKRQSRKEPIHMPSVILISYTPEPEKSVAAAAKLCYSSTDIEGIREGLTTQKAADFVDMLSEIGHESPIEHANFTFGIEGVSRSLLAQITRHRHASFSVQSQRYVRERQFEYVTPPEIEKLPAAKKIFLRSMEEDQKAYEELTAILKEEHLKRLLDEGKPQEQAEKAAEKAAIEDARFVLPNACNTKMIVTMNARSLHNFFVHRCCNRAQWEIREVATQMLRLVIDVAPNLFKNAGPRCINGRCPEGKMTCGKMDDIQYRFRAIHAVKEDID